MTNDSTRLVQLEKQSEKILKLLSGTVTQSPVITEKGLHDLEIKLRDHIDTEIDEMADKIGAIVSKEIKTAFETLKGEQDSLKEKVYQDHETLVLLKSTTASNTEKLDRLNKVVISGNGEKPLIVTARESLKIAKETSKSIDELSSKQSTRRRRDEFLSNILETLPDYIPLLATGLGILGALFKSAFGVLDGTDTQYMLLGAGQWLAPPIFIALVFRRAKNNGKSKHKNLNTA